jgi:uncharacterized iron-regulated protein
MSDHRALGQLPTAIFAALLLIGCAGRPVATPPPTGSWLTTHGAEHPLVGRIWSNQTGGYITADALAKGLRETRYTLLGEKHDNPDHHRLQAWIIDALLTAGRHGVVAFEMLDDDDVTALAALENPTPKSVAQAVHWTRSGWPPFVIYAPVFEAALTSGARLAAAHPTRDTLRTVMKEGIDAWPTARTVRLGLDHPLPGAHQADLRREIVETHCGHAPTKMVDAMMVAQQVKDAWMAWRLAQSIDTRGGVLIAGNGHVRRDRGVPRALTFHGGGQTGIVGILEVDDDRTSPQAYPLSLYDYVWFTPRLDDLDPCERFKRQLEQMKRPQ